MIVSMWKQFRSSMLLPMNIIIILVLQKYILVKSCGEQLVQKDMLPWKHAGHQRNIKLFP